MWVSEGEGKIRSPNGIYKRKQIGISFMFSIIKSVVSFISLDHLFLQSVFFQPFVQYFNSVFLLYFPAFFEFKHNAKQPFLFTQDLARYPMECF